MMSNPYQIPAMLVLPKFAIDDFWSAFAANHLAELVTSLHVLNPSTQPEAFATLIQVLSLLPDPKQEPYFRKFLRNSSQSKDLGNLVSAAFVRGVAWKRPSGPGHICTLIIHMIHWCDPSLGDDGKACVNVEVRKALATKLQLLTEGSGFERLDQSQQVEMRRLLQLLGTVEHLPADQYASSTRQHLEGSLDCCANPNCAEDADQTCSK
jgi:hypothetical protein